MRRKGLAMTIGLRNRKRIIVRTRIAGGHVVATREVSVIGTRAASTAAPVIGTPAPRPRPRRASAAASRPTASTAIPVPISRAVPLSTIPSAIPTRLAVIPPVVREAIVIRTLKLMLPIITDTITASC